MAAPSHTLSLPQADGLWPWIFIHRAPRDCFNGACQLMYTLTNAALATIITRSVIFDVPNFIWAIEQVYTGGIILSDPSTRVRLVAHLSSHYLTPLLLNIRRAFCLAITSAPPVSVLYSAIQTPTRSNKYHALEILAHKHYDNIQAYKTIIEQLIPEEENPYFYLCRQEKSINQIISDEGSTSLKVYIALREMDRAELELQEVLEEMRSIYQFEMPEMNLASWEKSDLMPMQQEVVPLEGIPNGNFLPLWILVHRLPRDFYNRITDLWLSLAKSYALITVVRGLMQDAPFIIPALTKFESYTSLAQHAFTHLSSQYIMPFAINMLRVSFLVIIGTAIITSALALLETYNNTCEFQKLGKSAAKHMLQARAYDNFLNPLTELKTANVAIAEALHLEQAEFKLAEITSQDVQKLIREGGAALQVYAAWTERAKEAGEYFQRVDEMKKIYTFNEPQLSIER